MGSKHLPQKIHFDFPICLGFDVNFIHYLPKIKASLMRECFRGGRKAGGRPNIR